MYLRGYMTSRKAFECKNITSCEIPALIDDLMKASRFECLLRIRNSFSCMKSSRRLDWQSRMVGVIHDTAK